MKKKKKHLFSMQPKKNGSYRAGKVPDMCEIRLKLPQTQIVCQYEKIHPTLVDLNKRYEFVVIDVAGRDSLELRSGLLVADLLVAPFRPSIADLETLGHLNRIVSDAKMINDKLTCKGVLSMSPTNPIIKERLMAEHVFSESPDFELFKTAIHDRKIYRDCLAEGKGVIEAGNAKARIEFDHLVEEILCHQ